ncbi:hypothetical protein [Streptomyces sp. NBC_00299]|uniref:hypothetical protein n=1 Tax=Streptomyces sp. NBC_00299 TaxID=2975705 RepID=UPI002E2C79A2|nr:hypothetical protein [Streptomyces sp. NBC_00299]
MPPELGAHLLNMDPPDHTRLRLLVSQAFTPRRVDDLRDRVQTMTDDLLDNVTGPDVDLMRTLANPLPMEVICELLGVSGETRGDFRAWTDTLLSPARGAATDSRAAIRQMYQFLTACIQDKRQHPTDDVLSGLIEARDEQGALTEQELLSLAFLTHFAGYDNAVHLIGNATLGLLLHPEQMKAARSGATPIRARESLDQGHPAATDAGSDD